MQKKIYPEGRAKPDWVAVSILLLSRSLGVDGIGCLIPAYFFTFSFSFQFTALCSSLLTVKREDQPCFICTTTVFFFVSVLDSIWWTFGKNRQL